jgi:hypothetical protein
MPALYQKCLMLIIEVCSVQIFFVEASNILSKRFLETTPSLYSINGKDYYCEVLRSQITNPLSKPASAYNLFFAIN